MRFQVVYVCVFFLLLSAVVPLQAEVAITPLFEFASPDPQWFGWFGPIGMTTNTWIAGAMGESNGAGAAYVYAWDGTNLTYQYPLFPSDSYPSNRFASDVSIEGTNAIIGAWGWDQPGASTVQDRGAIYFFSLQTDTWVQTSGPFSAPDTTNGDMFGVSVELQGDTLFVGAIQDDDFAPNGGSVYLFTNGPAGWTSSFKIYPPVGDRDNGDNFGADVSVCGDTLAVGSWLDDIGGMSDAGSAHMYERSGTDWVHVVKLTAPDGAAGDCFGEAVAVLGDTLLVGAHRADIGTATNAGAVYAFQRDPQGQWQYISKITATNLAAGDGFGVRLDINDNMFLVGAFGANVGPANDAGRIYAFAYTSTPLPEVSGLAAYDSFNEYAAGPLEGLSNSTETGSGGWSSGWSNSAACVVCDPDTALLYGHQDSGIGLCGGSRVLAVTNGAAGHALAALRDLTLNVDALTNLYASFLLRAITAPGSGVTNLLTVGPGVTASGPPFAGVLGANFYASLQTAPAGTQQSGFTQGITYFVVARFASASGSCNWSSVRLYINPTNADLQQAEQVLEDTAATPAKESCLRLATGNYGAGNEYWIDEIRIGANWSDVVPLASSSADCDNDNLPDDWELRYFGGLTNATATADTDYDDCDNLGEFIALTDPTNIASFFRIESAAWNTNVLDVSFLCVTNRRYGLEFGTNALTTLSWMPVPDQTNVAGDAEGSMTLSDTNTAESFRFYRISVRTP